MNTDLQHGLHSSFSVPRDDAMPRKVTTKTPKNSTVPKLRAELRKLILAARERVTYGEEMVSALATPSRWRTLATG